MARNPAAAPAGAGDDRYTTAALAALAYVLSMLAHEALGHGGACLAAGGRVTALWALDLGCDLRALPRPTAVLWTRLGAAAGPLTPLVLGGPLLTWLRASGRRDAAARDAAAPTFAWLAAAFLLLPNVGYFCLAAFSAGDWAIALAGGPAARGWGVPVALGGAVLYWLTTRTLFRVLGGLTRGAPGGDGRRGRGVAWTGYAVAAVLAFGVAARQHGAASAAALSGLTGAAASLAGTSGLVWGALALRRPPVHDSRGALRPLTRRPALIAAGLAAALAFVGLLGPGIRTGVGPPPRW